MGLCEAEWMVSIARACLIAEKLYAFADTLYCNGKHNLSDFEVDVWVGINVIVKWNQ